MKKIKFIFALLFVGALLQSCTGDIEDLADPRDAVAKKFRVLETNKDDNSERSYDDNISKDANDKTVVIFNNFHDEGLKVKASLAGTIITISQQEIEGLKVVGGGSISTNLKEVTLNYTVDDGTTEKPVAFEAVYSPPTVAKKGKKDKNLQ